MPAYRVYRIDGSGRIHSAEVVEADSDAGALRLANEMLTGASGELWLEQRMISKFGTNAHATLRNGPKTADR